MARARWLAHGLRAAKTVACGAAGMVENDDTSRTCYPHDQRSCLILIDRRKRGIIMKIGDGAVMPDQLEARMIQIKVAAAAIPDLDLAVVILAVMLGGRAARLRGVIDGTASIRRCQISQAGTNAVPGCCHGGSPFLTSQLAQRQVQRRSAAPIRISSRRTPADTTRIRTRYSITRTV